jgi:pimeloyl-ACP methyl ester carboxylesterase
MPYRTPGLLITEHELEVPLDHDDPGGERIAVFARELADPDGADRPYLVFFEGGPGYEAPRPRLRTELGWLDRALKEFRVLLLDQRGTGRSAPVGTLAGLAPREQAERLANFRADSIVRDAEAFRRALGVDRWSVLGQSYGGFCVTAYLSLAPEGLREAFITGGLAPVGRHIDEVYAATYERVRDRTRRYFERYPDDRLPAREDLVLPSGDRLSARRLAQLGSLLGMSDGFERLHHLLELPPDSPAFLHDMEAATPFARNPIYAVLHEACYADGGSTRWAAERLRPDDLVLTGEHIFPWMFEEYGALAPLREAAHLLADREWPRLYDEDVLRANEVPAAALIYADDLYVERAFSEETAALIRGLRPWLTNEYEHNGLRADGERILGRLIDLARGRA